jgi:hypothetical protein
VNARLPVQRVQLQVLLPVVAGGLEGVVDALPARIRALLEQEPDVPALVGSVHLLAELAGNGGKQFVGARSWARHVDDDCGKRHRGRS